MGNLGIQFERLHRHVRAPLRADEAPRTVLFNSFNPQLRRTSFGDIVRGSGGYGHCFDQLQNTPEDRTRGDYAGAERCQTEAGTATTGNRIFSEFLLRKSKSLSFEHTCGKVGHPRAFGALGSGCSA